MIKEQEGHSRARDELTEAEDFIGRSLRTLEANSSAGEDVDEDADLLLHAYLTDACLNFRRGEFKQSEGKNDEAKKFYKKAEIRYKNVIR